MTTRAPKPSSPVVSAREHWMSRLIDTSRHNPLLYYKDGKTGTLNLSATTASALQALLNGASVSVSELFTEVQQPQAAKQIRKIRDDAKANREERGMETLYLAWGLVEWASSDSRRPPAAPLFLVPIAISTQGGAQTLDVRLERTGTPQVNLVLLYTLAQQYGLTSVHALRKDDVDERIEPFDPKPTITQLRTIATAVPKFDIKPAAILGIFKFQKMALMDDLRKNAAAIDKHPLILAIAGDLPAQQALLNARAEVDARDLDTLHPDHEFQILTADSSQQRVITAVTQGQSGVIQGPPGTGKSQTITNLITTLVATGKRVLFVAEKRAALEVVRNRLAEEKLGYLALDLHGTTMPKRAIVEHFKVALAQIANPPHPDVARTHREFQDRRSRLNAYVARLHVARSPSMLSVYTIQGQLLSLPPDVRTTTRWRGAALTKLTTEQVDALRALLIEAGDFDDLFLGHSRSPWAKAKLQDVEAVHAALSLVEQLATVTLPALQQAATTAAQATNLPSPRTLEQIRLFVQVLPSMSDTLERFYPALFDEDIPSIVAKLEPAHDGLLQATWSWLTDSEHRGAYRAARKHATVDQQVRVWSWSLYPDVAKAEKRQRRWQHLLGEGTQVPEQTQVEDAYAALTSVDLEDAENQLGQLSNLFGRSGFSSVPFDKLAKLLAALCSDRITPYRIPRVLTLRQRITQVLGEQFIRELATTRPPAEQWPTYLEHAWLESCLEDARNTDPAIASFSAASHSRYIQEFQTFDAERTKRTAERIRRVHADRMDSVLRTYSGQTAIVRREIGKSRGHLSLRQLLDQAGDVVTHLCPCWMASPLSVSQLIPTDKRYFDVVIFDEASQVLPEAAMAAMLRGTSVVVAGDERQLPPSDFFTAGGGDDEDEEVPAPTKGFDSLLDLMIGCAEPWRLTWHYRSQDESLIAFSNQHIYDNELVTFPSPARTHAVRHELVRAPEEANAEETSAAEVRRVIELMVAHAQQRYDETLGVIALGIPHAERIKQAYDEMVNTHPQLKGFFGEEGKGQVFIKNLEQVQGDERDAIILTLGVTAPRDGRVLLTRFGPLTQEGGERRLNVAITRARKRMTVVSSFEHTQIVPAPTSGRGITLLRSFLEYADEAQRGIGITSHEDAPELDLFERDVYRILTERGLDLHPQFGASQRRISFAVRHPSDPTRFIMAIECDGPAYAAQFTARDRDRLRQKQLESLGWRYHRIWSLDWAVRREDEIERVLRAYRSAISG